MLASVCIVGAKIAEVASTSSLPAGKTWYTLSTRHCINDTPDVFPHTTDDGWRIATTSMNIQWLLVRAESPYNFPQATP
jgi:hypothetical protein